MTIYKIFNSNGKNRQDWEKFTQEIKGKDKQMSYNISCVITAQLCNFKHIELCVDIIDYIMDIGTEEMISNISSVNFGQNIVNLFKYKNVLDDKIRQKILFLIKKWGIKKKNRNYEYAYSYLESCKFEFPNDDMFFPTYYKYLKNENDTNKIDSSFTTPKSPKKENLQNHYRMRKNASSDKIQKRQEMSNTFSGTKDQQELHNCFSLGNNILAKIREFRFDIEKKLKKINEKIDKAFLKCDIDKIGDDIKLLKDNEGIRCDNLIKNCSENPSYKAYLDNVKKDIENTEKRYELLKHGMKPEPFISHNKSNNNLLFYK